VAALLFLIIALRGGRAPAPAPKADDPPARTFARSGNPLTDAATKIADDALDSAADAIRKSPREAVLGAIAMAVVLGIVIGRR
jgi:hypothetical protein